MAEESIAALRKPGFPTTSNSEKTFQTTIEYIGEYATLAAAEPVSNALWGEFDGLVTTTNLSKIHGTSPLYGELTVVVEYAYSQADSPEQGVAREVTYEVEWMLFTRSLYEHPAFAVGQGGMYALTSEDVAAIEMWKNEQDVPLKATYAYQGSPEDIAKSYLSGNAQKFAKAIELGLGTYEDFAPVFRRNTRYTNGLPNTSSAGLKEEPPQVPGVPQIYEWRKTADRATSNGQTRWDKSEEWIGAQKVLLDKINIYF